MPFLYLTTQGWKTCEPHEVEIWYVEHGGAFYVVSELREKSHWVQNIKRDPDVRFRVSESEFEGEARIVDTKREVGLAGEVTRLMEENYGWGEGLIVELRPRSRGVTGSRLLSSSPPEEESHTDDK